MKLFTLCASLCVLASTVVANEVSFGLAKDNAWNSSEHKARMETHGLTDHAVVYYKLNSEANRANPFDWVRDNYVSQDIPTTMVLIIDDGDKSTVGTSEGTDVSAGVPGLLEKVVRGDFDVALEELASRVKNHGPITIRPFHEIDGGWYEWGMYATGNSCELAAAAVNHVIDTFEGEGATNVSWDINVNRRDGRGQVFGAAECFVPLVEGRIDSYSVSTYNRCGSAARYVEERSFAADFAPIYERLTELTSVPVNVAEVSTSGLCAPRMEWFEEMIASFDSRFPRTEKVTFFFGVVPIGRASNDVEIYWGFDQEPEMLPLFRELILSQEEARAAAEPAKVRPEARPTRVVRAARPVSVPPQTPADNQPVLSIETGRSLSWEAWGDLRTTFGDEPIPGYGDTGTVLQGTYRLNYLSQGTVQSGPSLLIGGVLSDKCDDRYWQCQIRTELSYVWRMRPTGFGDYNRLQFGLGVGYRYYADSPPSRLENGDAYGFAGFTWVAGGDFK